MLREWKLFAVCLLSAVSIASAQGESLERDVDAPQWFEGEIVDIANSAAELPRERVRAYIEYQLSKSTFSETERIQLALLQSYYHVSDARYLDALAILDEAPQVEVVGVPTVIEFYLQRGIVNQLHNQLSEANCRDFDRAYAVAKNGIYPELYVRAAGRHVSCLTNDIGRESEAVSVLAEAMEVASRTEIDKAIVIDLLVSLGEINQRLYDHQTTQAIFTQGLQLAQSEALLQHEFDMLFNLTVESFFVRDEIAYRSYLDQLWLVGGANRYADFDFFCWYLEGLYFSPYLVNDPRKAVEAYFQAVQLRDSTSETYYSNDAVLQWLLSRALADGITSIREEFIVFIEEHPEFLDYDSSASILSDILSDDYESILFYTVALENHYANAMFKLADHVRAYSGEGVAEAGVRYQAEIARQQLEIEQLNNAATRAESTKMRWQRNVVFSLVGFMVLLVSYLIYSRNRFRELSQTDVLTGIANRRRAYRELDKAMRSMESGEAAYDDPSVGLAVLLLDVDKFKTVNDNLGHDAGDRVLKELSRIAKLAIHRRELVARFGGEEFFILMPRTNFEAAVETAERLRLIISQSDVGIGSQRVTTSVGLEFVDRLDLQAGMTADEIVNRADRALYDAKSSGRNCVRWTQNDAIDIESFKATQHEEDQRTA
ncbi:GGDEF domain-containing protein [Umboniibacter marinipuniceus]|uniref:diguanylate cyclase n=1 Tax=Umboniibacter marinipuniceus TaxID=569599 RepID=A0A3M0A2D2_9GAMM|nr:GGDEF domain-containing protein [Umboniibacter marinipuniceus]RMA78807.1 diguanylate cyclase (GGDEF)-like protein [Umboniibacter marinipuniceus]